MDYTQILQPLFDALWYPIPYAILSAVAISPWFKGKAGEVVVNCSAKPFELIKNTQDFEVQV